MKLSTRGRYGLRLMMDIALHCKESPVTLKDISKRQEISEKYLWHLINPLKNAGLLKSWRGARGGYMLGKPLNKISLEEIVRVVEGSLFIVECTEKPSVCPRSHFCVAREVWGTISKKIADSLKSITLQDILENHNKKIATAIDYHI